MMSNTRPPKVADFLEMVFLVGPAGPAGRYLAEGSVRPAGPADPADAGEKTWQVGLSANFRF